LDSAMNGGPVGSGTGASALGAGIDGGFLPLAAMAANPVAAQAAPTGGPLAREFAAAAAANPVSSNGESSMADTLQSAFGLADGGGGDAVPAHVRTAYGRIRALGL